MICYLKLELWDNVIDRIYFENLKFLTITYPNYCIIYYHHKLYYLHNHMLHIDFLK